MGPSRPAAAKNAVDEPRASAGGRGSEEEQQVPSESCFAIYTIVYIGLIYPGIHSFIHSFMFESWSSRYKI
jgi:hypothetical protein